MIRLNAKKKQKTFRQEGLHEFVWGVLKIEKGFNNVDALSRKEPANTALSLWLLDDKLFYVWDFDIIFRYIDVLKKFSTNGHNTKTLNIKHHRQAEFPLPLEMCKNLKMKKTGMETPPLRKTCKMSLKSFYAFMRRRYRHEPGNILQKCNRKHLFSCILPGAGLDACRHMQSTATRWHLLPRAW